MRPSRPAVVTTVLALLLGPAAAPVADGTDVARCLRARVDAERGSRPLSRDADLERVAARHADEMSRAGRIYHGKPDYRDRAWGENVGVGPSCGELHAAFMSSTGHRRNVLDPTWVAAGYGAAERDGAWYVVERFAGPAPAIPIPRRPVPRPRSTCAER